MSTINTPFKFDFNIQNHAEEDPATPQDIYGANAVLSNEPQADPLAGKSIDIQTTGTQTYNVSLGDQSAPLDGGEGQGQEPPKQDPEGTPEGDKNSIPSLEDQIKLNNQAGEAAKADLANKGVDFAALEAEWSEKGELSESSLKALEAAGYPKAIVDNYINGMNLTAKAFEAEVLTLAGGRDQFTQVQGFVKSQGDAYVKAFNQAIESGNVTQIAMIIKGVQSQMVDTRGTNNPSLIGGKPPDIAKVTTFANRKEMIAAMSDKRYLRDPVYTQMVQQKTINTEF